MARRLTVILGCALLLVGLLLWGCGGPEGTKPPTTTPTTHPTAANTAPAVTPAEKVVYRVSDHWDEVEKLYQFTGEAAKPLTDSSPSPIAKLYPQGTSAVPYPLLYAHPAVSKKGSVGETILRFSTSLPTEPTKLVFGAFLGKAPGPSDGSDFIVRVGGKLLFKELVTPKASIRRSLDLGANAGKTVTIELITDTGTNKNPGADWAMWVDPRIVVAQ